MLDKAGNANAHQKSWLIFQQLGEKRVKRKKMMSLKETPETIPNENKHMRIFCIKMFPIQISYLYFCWGTTPPNV